MIVIIRRPVQRDGSNTGLGRYADSIEHCISDRNPSVVRALMTTRYGKIPFLKDGLIRPFFQCMNLNSSENVFHATDELCAFMFPFIRGRKIITVHHIIKPGESRRTYHAIWNLVVKAMLKRADDIIAISEDTAKDVKALGIEPSKINIITNRIAPCFKVLDMKKEKLIGCVAEFIPRKRVALTISAFSELRKMKGMEGCRLCICGKGILDTELRNQTEELGISDSVSFVSGLSENEIVELYNRCRLVFNTSEHEGLGICTIEAQRCGTPVLHLTDADIPELVLKASVPCASPKDMAEKARTLLEDPDEYTRLRDESIGYSETFGRDFCEKYRDIIDGNR